MCLSRTRTEIWSPTVEATWTRGGHREGAGDHITMHDGAHDQGVYIRCAGCVVVCRLRECVYVEGGQRVHLYCGSTVPSQTMDGSAFMTERPSLPVTQFKGSSAFLITCVKVKVRE